ncbi:MAG: PHP domain-containing protein, partial [Chloroflexota bacterium]|nr:PHP domain-containing protein [Chloroflexota bacterium]
AISSKIAELLDTGSLAFYERLRAKVPDGVVDVMRVPGIGPKTAWRLYQELGVADIEELEAALSAGKIQTLKGLGAKMETRIREGLQKQTSAPGRFLLGEALPLARDLVATYRAAAPGLHDVCYAGSVRRSCPTIGDIDLVAAASDSAAVLDVFLTLPHVAQVEQQAENRVDVRLHNGKSCSLFVVAPDRWGAALVNWTGSGAHRERLAQIAVGHGLTLREDGLWRGDVFVPARTEAVVYEALGLPFVEPELREGRGEIEAARGGRLPALIERVDIRGDLHTHTGWSDGHGTVAEAAEAARARGYSYYAITDHGLYMGMVNGLDAARLQAQRAEIDAVNADYASRGIDFRLLQGIEVDILPDGSLALPDDVLATLDWVVASLHVSLRQDRQTVTERLLQAIRNPHVDCIGHPTGRLLLRRDGADLDMDTILTAAAQSGVVLEVDGSYPRLDLDAEYVKRAIDLGIRIAVDSDAHHPRELDGVDYGVLTARRGWATRRDVVNAWPWEAIEEHKARRQDRAR